MMLSVGRCKALAEHPSLCTSLSQSGKPSQPWSLKTAPFMLGFPALPGEYYQITLHLCKICFESNSISSGNACWSVTASTACDRNQREHGAAFTAKVHLCRTSTFLPFTPAHLCSCAFPPKASHKARGRISCFSAGNLAERLAAGC